MSIPPQHEQASEWLVSERSQTEGQLWMTSRREILGKLSIVRGGRSVLAAEGMGTLGGGGSLCRRIKTLRSVAEGGTLWRVRCVL